jgi:hypothetical protein
MPIEIGEVMTEIDDGDGDGQGAGTDGVLSQAQLERVAQRAAEIVMRQDGRGEDLVEHAAGLALELVMQRLRERARVD